MSGKRIEEDWGACLAGWGPCLEAYGFAHACQKRDGHDGVHVCEICGSRRVNALSDHTEGTP